MNWLDQKKLDPELKAELEQMNQEQIKEAFAGELSFGTAGIRGIMGVGTNRLNIHIIQKVSLGLARYLQNKYPNQEIKVAIGYDSRHNSVAFAKATAQVLATYGIKSYIYDRVKPTPMLSFLVRYYHCQAGIMITASHNPKEYNGYKVYNETGAQLNLEEVAKLTTEINKINNIFAEEFTNNPEEYIEYITSDFDQVYLQNLENLLIEPVEKKNLKVVFTPLHGTSQDIMPKAFAKFGYQNLICVEEQMQPDPNFSNTTSSNPEEIACYQLAIEYAKANNADLIIANDPDADRLGIMVKHKNNYVALNGNQTGTLLIDYLLKFNHKQSAILYKTIVTGEMGATIARKHGIEVQELLTGFKFIGEQIHLLEEKQNLDKFFFGYEESYGYLISPIARDKDAIQAALLVSEMTNYYLEQEQIDLVTKLEQLYTEYGYYIEQTHSFTLAGTAGIEKIQAIMEQVINEDLGSIIDEKINQKINYNIDDTGLPKANVVKFIINDGWVVFRPSGTEPKLKIYISIKSSDLTTAQQKHDIIISKLEQFINNF